MTDANFEGLGARRPTVQLVEDEPDIVPMLRVVLEQVGFHLVRVAGDGQVALNQLRRTRPDLILTGILTPYLDGWGFIERLRANQTGADRIPVVVQSTTATGKRPAQYLALGADRVIAKPFDIEELISLMVEVTGLLPRPDLPVPPADPPYRPEPSRFGQRVRRVAEEFGVTAERVCACTGLAELAAALSSADPLVALAQALEAEIHADAEDDVVATAIGPLSAVAGLVEMRSPAELMASHTDQAAVVDQYYRNARWYPVYDLAGVESARRVSHVLKVQCRGVQDLSAGLDGLADALEAGVWELASPTFGFAS